MILRYVFWADRNPNSFNTYVSSASSSSFAPLSHSTSKAILGTNGIENNVIGDDLLLSGFCTTNTLFQYFIHLLFRIGTGRGGLIADQQIYKVINKTLQKGTKGLLGNGRTHPGYGLLINCDIVGAHDKFRLNFAAKIGTFLRLAKFFAK